MERSLIADLKVAVLFDSHEAFLYELGIDCTFDVLVEQLILCPTAANG
jgi:hypothetical protein